MSCTAVTLPPISVSEELKYPVITNKTRTSFLDLPRELRDAIYNLVLIHDSHIHVLRTRFVGPTLSPYLKTETSVLEPCDSTKYFATLRCTCRQIDHEVRERFFSANIFHFGAHQSRYDNTCLDSTAARFAFSHIRQLVVEYTASVSGDLFGFICVQLTIALRCPIYGNGGWQLRTCPSYDYRSYRPPQRIYGCVEAAILQFLSMKAPGELLDSESVKAIVRMMDKELLRVV